MDVVEIMCGVVVKKNIKVDEALVTFSRGVAFVVFEG